MVRQRDVYRVDLAAFQTLFISVIRIGMFDLIFTRQRFKLPWISRDESGKLRIFTSLSERWQHGNLGNISQSYDRVSHLAFRLALAGTHRPPPEKQIVVRACERVDTGKNLVPRAIFLTSADSQGYLHRRSSRDDGFCLRFDDWSWYTVDPILRLGGPRAGRWLVAHASNTCTHRSRVGSQTIHFRQTRKLTQGEFGKRLRTSAMAVPAGSADRPSLCRDIHTAQEFGRRSALLVFLGTRRFEHRGRDASPSRGRPSLARRENRNCANRARRLRKHQIVGIREFRCCSGPLAAFARGAVRWVRNELRIRETSAGPALPTPSEQKCATPRLLFDGYMTLPLMAVMRRWPRGISLVLVRTSKIRATDSATCGLSGKHHLSSQRL
jgi:hypothetical protein